MAYPYPMMQRSYIPANFPQRPFAGAPPPQPPNMQINAQAWRNGTWAVNPAFNASRWNAASSAAAAVTAASSSRRQQPQNYAVDWVPGPGWAEQRAAEWQVQQAQIAAAGSYNPYKRVPRAPSAAYMASKLSDNPLGLENMVPRDELFGPKNDEGAMAATPWVWNPRGLGPEDATTLPTDVINAARARSPVRSPPPPSIAPAGLSANAPSGQMPPPMYVSPGREMPGQAPTPQPRISPPARNASDSAITTPNRPRTLQRNSEPPPSREFQPTFSSNIVRTPEHYRTRGNGPPLYGPALSQSVPKSTVPIPSVPNNSVPVPSVPVPSFPTPSVPIPSVPNSSVPPGGSVPTPSVPTPVPTPSIPHLTRQMDRLSTNSLSRTATLPANFGGSSHFASNSLGRSGDGHSMSGASQLSDEPGAGLLSPLIIPATQRLPIRPLGPSATLDVIPEGGSVRTPKKRHKHKISTSGMGASPSPNRSSLAAASSSTSPPRHGSVTPPRSNPLPEPPQDPPRHPVFGVPVQRTPPPTWRARRRVGFWNRRGDHLTMDGYIVYAPANVAYPTELQEYPEDGYRDQKGDHVPFLASRPELPDSLPRQGHPPKLPYERFVVYEYQQ